MSAARQLNLQMSLREALEHVGVSRRVWYYKSKRREIGLNQDVVDSGISVRRPTYGTRHMAAQIPRVTVRPLRLHQEEDYRIRA